MYLERSEVASQSGDGAEEVDEGDVGRPVGAGGAEAVGGEVDGGDAVDALDLVAEARGPAVGADPVGAIEVPVVVPVAELEGDGVVVDSLGDDVDGVGLAEVADLDHGRVHLCGDEKII